MTYLILVNNGKLSFSAIINFSFLWKPWNQWWMNCGIFLWINAFVTFKGGFPTPTEKTAFKQMMSPVTNDLTTLTRLDLSTLTISELFTAVLLHFFPRIFLKLSRRFSRPELWVLHMINCVRYFKTSWQYYSIAARATFWIQHCSN